ncbi:GH39 family glycosyl hydrolase [Klebsiella quasipneumoniae]|uniref:GH39 family glycosyl hydrolase n=1 Tax=Klebsiella quasipneumoniae TaxID=1463165 RepID=UPI0029650FE0|nr:hypothetical protein [Klebsiella quasipneumoniae]
MADARTFTKVNGSHSIGDNFLGVALGGGNLTFHQKKYYIPLMRLQPSSERLESITGDYRAIYNPSTNSWDFRELDKEIELMDFGNKTIIANVFYTPKFLSSCPESKYYPYCAPIDYVKWNWYVKNIVEHVYNKYKIKYWEIGNEPSGHFFFRSSMDSFFDYYVQTASVIKSVNPDVLVGGVADNPFFLQTYSSFFKKIHGSGNKKLLDFISFHWYGQWGHKDDAFNPKAIIRLSSSLKEQLNTFGFGDLPMYLTEWNLLAVPENFISESQVNSFFVASQYFLHWSNIDRALFFRAEPYSNMKSSLINSSGSITTTGQIFSLLKKIYSSNNYKLVSKENVYVFWSEENKDFLIAYYDEKNMAGQKNKSINVKFPVALGIRNKCEYYSIANGFDSASGNVDKIPCDAQGYIGDIIMHNFDVIHISYFQ